MNIGLVDNFNRYVCGNIYKIPSEMVQQNFIYIEIEVDVCTASSPGPLSQLINACNIDISWERGPGDEASRCIGYGNIQSCSS